MLNGTKILNIICSNLNNDEFNDGINTKELKVVNGSLGYYLLGKIYDKLNHISKALIFYKCFSLFFNYLIVTELDDVQCTLI